MRKVWILVILVLIAIFGGRIWYLNQNKTDETKEIKVAVVIPLSGFDENLTDRVLTTLKSATQELTKGKDYHIKYLIEDGKYTVKDSIAAFNKTKAEKPAAFIVFGDVPLLGLKSFINETKIPVIALALGDSTLPAKSPYLFRVSLSSEEMVKELANFAYNDKGIHEITIIKAKNNYGDDGSHFFQKYFTELGGKILIEESFNITDMDVRAQAIKVLQHNPKMIFVWGFGSGYINTFNQLAELGYQGDFMTDFSLTDKSVWENIHNQGKDIYFATGDFKIDEMDENYIQTYLNKIGQNPDGFASFAYVSVEVLLKSLENPDGIETGLYAIKNFPTAMGQISFDKDGEPHPHIIIKQMQSNGTAKIIKE